MSSSPTIVVKKGGVLTALVSGVFATLIVCIVCGVGLGWYAMNIFDRKVSDLAGGGRALLETLPEWRESIAVAGDLLDDRRAPEYREQLEMSVRVFSDGMGENIQWAVVEVTNSGDEVVTFLSARVVLSDEEGIPVREYRTFVATPLTIDDGDWRGPLLPGATCRFKLDCCVARGDLSGSIQVTDLRVWNSSPQVAMSPVETAASAPVEQDVQPPTP